MKHKKPKLGQHYLINRGACSRIVEAAEVDDRQVVEIGPGRGALTGLLYPRAARLTLIEPDDALAADIGLACPNADVIRARAETVDLSALPGPLTVVSNLPYNVSVLIFKHCIAHKANIERMVLMFQKEVADRIAATPGGKSYGSLSVVSAYHFEIKKLLSVHPGSFRPQPKVDSAVLTFTPFAAPPVDADPEQLFPLIRTAFAQKRRMLRNNLKHAYTADSIRNACMDAGVAETARAETVSLEAFAKLANRLEPLPAEK